MSEDFTKPLFPIYIPTKGRSEYRHTIKALEKMAVPYHIIVEEQEYADYLRYVDAKKILALDKSFQRNYETLDDLGDSMSKGSGPARNFAWEHAKANGFSHYWCVDDNIRAFHVFNDNRIHKVANGKFFRYQEEFVLRYKNIGMAGPQYEMFVTRLSKRPPFVFNHRVYSCNLIRTDLPFRWVGRYNEDTILTLNLLTNCWCTVLFNMFLQGKIGTQRIPGGNTDALYKNGTFEKTELLYRQFPKYVRRVIKWGRPHHYIDYSVFTHRPIKADDYNVRIKKNLTMELVPNV